MKLKSIPFIDIHKTKALSAVNDEPKNEERNNNEKNENIENNENNEKTNENNNEDRIDNTKEKENEIVKEMNVITKKYHKFK